MSKVTNTVVTCWRFTMSYGHARSLNTLPVLDEPEQKQTWYQTWEEKVKHPVYSMLLHAPPRT